MHSCGSVSFPPAKIYTWKPVQPVGLKVLTQPAQLTRFLINLAACERCKSRFFFLSKALTNFSVYHTFNDLDEVHKLVLWWSFTKPPFLHFVVVVFVLTPSHFSYLCWQCRSVTNMNPAPVSSCGRRGQPFCKATNLIPPAWAGGPWTSIIYWTHAVVWTNTLLCSISYSHQGERMRDRALETGCMSIFFKIWTAVVYWVYLHPFL